MREAIKNNNKKSTGKGFFLKIFFTSLIEKIASKDKANPPNKNNLGTFTGSVTPCVYTTKVIKDIPINNKLLRNFSVLDLSTLKSYTDKARIPAPRRGTGIRF